MQANANLSPPPGVTPDPESDRQRQPTATSAPPPADSAIRITVWECQQGLGGLPAGINVWAGEWNDSGSGSSVEFSVPGRYQRAGWSVSLPPGWTSPSTSGEASVGSSINVVATSPACFRSVDPRTPLPSLPPTPIPDCADSHGPRGSTIAVSVPGASSQTFGNTRGFNKTNPPLDAWSVDAPTVPASVPLIARFNFGTLRARDFEADHYGQASVHLRIQDVTSDNIALRSIQLKLCPVLHGMGAARTYHRPR